MSAKRRTVKAPCRVTPLNAANGAAAGGRGSNSSVSCVWNTTVVTPPRSGVQKRAILVTDPYGRHSDSDVLTTLNPLSSKEYGELPKAYRDAIDDSHTYGRVYDRVLTDPAVARETRSLLAGLPIDKKLLTSNEAFRYKLSVLDEFHLEHGNPETPSPKRMFDLPVRDAASIGSNQTL